MFKRREKQMMPRVTGRDRDYLHKRIPVAAGTKPKEEQVWFNWRK